MAHAKAFSDTLRIAAECGQQSKLQLHAAFDEYRPSPVNEIVADVALGREPGDAVVMSSYVVRSVFYAAFIRSVLNFHYRQRFDGALRVFLFSFSTSDGFTFEDAPALEVDKMRRKARLLLQQLGLQALCTFEIDVLAKKLPGEHARRLILHVHGLCWTRDPYFQPVAQAKRLSALARYANPLDISGVHFQSRAMAAAADTKKKHPFLHKHPEREQTARSMAYLAHYITKAPRYAKNRYIDASGAPRVRYDAGNFRLKTAVRFNEIMSHFTPEQMVFAVGEEANELRLDIRTTLRQHFPHVGVASSRQKMIYRIDQAWSRYLADYASLGFEPSVVYHRSG